MRRLASEPLLSTHAFDVVRGTYRREDGTEVSRDVVAHPGSVAIVAHDDEHVYLVRQPREAVEEDGLLELPAGTLDPEDGSALECARRELREETGLVAADWEELRSIYPTPGYSSEVQPIFRATDLSAQDAEPDDDEQIEVVRWALVELDEVVSTLRDATTLVGLMLLQRRLADIAE